MQNKKFEIVNNDVTVVVKPSWKEDGNFDFYEVYVNSKPNVRYRKYSYKLPEEQNGIQYHALYKYIYYKLKQQADVELKKYISKNISNTEMYTEKDKNGNFIFWGNLASCKDHYSISNNVDHSISYDKIIVNGKVEVRQGSYICIFDLTQDDFVDIYNEYGDYKKSTALQAIYGSILKEILAVEQYKKNICHNAYSEIVKLNKFLESKKSVKIILRDGRKLVLKMPDLKLNANSLLRFWDNKFYIRDSYYIKPNLENKLPIQQLDYLQYGKTKHIINVNNLEL